MKRAGSCLPVLLDEELSQVNGGMNGGLGLPSTAHSLMTAYNSLDYKYIGGQCKPVLDQTIGGAAAGFAIGKSLPMAGEGAIAGAVSGATTMLLNQDYSKWVKPQPQSSWADFRRLDNK
jgi:hypothetical protein